MKYSPRRFPSPGPSSLADRLLHLLKRATVSSTESPSTLTKAVLAKPMLREDLDAACDMRMLVHAGYFVGTASNWMHTIVALRLAMSPTNRFRRSDVVMTGSESKHMFPIYRPTDPSYLEYWDGVMNSLP